MPEEFQHLAEVYRLITEFFINYSFQIIGAIIILIIGILCARKLGQWTLSLCTRKQLDITLSHFIASLVKMIFIIFIAIIALSKIGISVTPFIAAIGALSLGAGLAVQGLLSNYSAGLNIILTRPFVVGDTIQVQGVAGLVKEITLAHTQLWDEDNVIISIPNRHIVGEIIHNSQAQMLVEAKVGIAYDSDPDLALDTIKTCIESIEGVDQQRSPQVGIDAFADSSINLCARVWVPTKQYHSLRFQINKAIFEALHNANIKIPFPQREVTLLGKAADTVA